ncbi:hypothetical protein BVC80_1663g40 [Macleaya cordata]|uniref:Transmembrane protein n=1 Tax=Macleaya cordata TaxID=56857 RepID=A0A200RBR0_MACCD|nr:hypothetical protein BVC80_1663g40 [Macleaya cordata]
MAITISTENLLQFKSHFIFATLVSLLLISLIFVAPRLLTILAYFWPLFVSTGLFLVAIVFFGRVSPDDPDSTTFGERTGEGLLNYVAG